MVWQTVQLHSDNGTNFITIYLHRNAQQMFHNSDIHLMHPGAHHTDYISLSLTLVSIAINIPFPDHLMSICHKKSLKEYNNSPSGFFIML